MNKKNSFYEVVSNYVGDKEIIAGVAVRKLNKKKYIFAPFGTLGLCIQELPQLGIGVETVNKGSILFDTVRRGYIFSEFMGKSLKNVSGLEFKQMVCRKDVSMLERKLVVEYVAADFTVLFGPTKETSGHHSPKQNDTMASESKSNSSDKDLNTESKSVALNDTNNGELFSKQIASTTDSKPCEEESPTNKSKTNNESSGKSNDVVKNLAQTSSLAKQTSVTVAKVGASASTLVYVPPELSKSKSTVISEKQLGTHSHNSPSICANNKVGTHKIQSDEKKPLTIVTASTPKSTPTVTNNGQIKVVSKSSAIATNKCDPTTSIKSKTSSVPSSKVNLSNTTYDNWLSTRKEEWKNQRKKGSIITNKVKLSNDNFNEWLSDRKSTWNFKDRVRKATSKEVLDVKKELKKAKSKEVLDVKKELKFQPATSFGLPEGWTVRIQLRSRYTFRSPTGKLFYSKKSVFEYLKMDPTLSLVPIKHHSHLTKEKNGTRWIIKNSVIGDNRQKVALSSSHSDTLKMSQQVFSERKPLNKESVSKTLSTTKMNESILVGTDTRTGLPMAKPLPVSNSIGKNAKLNSIEKYKPSQDSLSEVIEKLKDARKKVDQFGPIPWKGCRIVKGPPAPALLQIRIQNVPSKYGAGVFEVHRDSPLFGQVQQGDIITHCMGIPLYGLSCDEVKRVLSAENKMERVLQIAPQDYKFEKHTPLYEGCGQETHLYKVDATPKAFDRTSTIPSEPIDIVHTRKSSNTLNETNTKALSTTKNCGDSLLGHTNRSEIRTNKPGGNLNTAVQKSTIIKTTEHSTKQKTSASGAVSLPLFGSIKSPEKKIERSVVIIDGKVNRSALSTTAEPSSHQKEVSNIPLSTQNETKGSLPEHIKNSNEGTRIKNSSTDKTLHIDTQKLNRLEPILNADKSPSIQARIEGVIVNCMEQMQKQGKIQDMANAKPAKPIGGYNVNLLAFRNWTMEEDMLIRKLVEKHGIEDWDAIALEVPAKSATQCRFRWINVIQPSLQIQERSEAFKENRGALINQPRSETFLNHFRKVIVPPFQGELGVGLQQHRSKKGVGVASISHSSPLLGKLQRGDIITKFMEKSLQGMEVQQVVDLMKEKKYEETYLIVTSSSLSSRGHNEELKQHDMNTRDKYPKEMGLENNVAKEMDAKDNGRTPKIFKVQVNDDTNEIKMPVCFAFDTNDPESQKIAAKRDKRCHEQYEQDVCTNKKQKLVA